MFRAVACLTKLQARKAFSTWVDYVAWKGDKRQIMQRYGLISRDAKIHLLRSMQ